jgi:hypothetical protein
MNREMCASLRPKGPVRKVPTSYDCSAESPGFNGGQHTYGGRSQPSRGRSSSHHNAVDIVEYKVGDNFAVAALRWSVVVLVRNRELRAANVRPPELLPQ